MYIDKNNSVTDVIYVIILVSIGSLNCTFENDFCNWKNKKSANYNWIRDMGSIDSSKISPAFDHTTGTQLGS